MKLRIKTSIPQISCDSQLLVGLFSSRPFMPRSGHVIIFSHSRDRELLGVERRKGAIPCHQLLGLPRDPLTTSTGQGACSTTRSAVLPSSKCSRPVCP